jgi:hypothetical protein
MFLARSEIVSTGIGKQIAHTANILFHSFVIVTRRCWGRVLCGQTPIIVFSRPHGSMVNETDYSMSRY